MNRLEKRLYWTCILLLGCALLWLSGSTVKLQAAENPSDPGPCSVASQHVDINGVLGTDLYYPTSDQCGDGIAAPYPAVAFAHGFGMFGLSDGAAENAGNGEHLASWGFVVAIPSLSDDVAQRIADMEAVLSYFETQTNSSGAFLYQKIDIDRLAAAGHSFGGATVLALAAQDPRPKAVVALDPVYHQGGPGSNPEIWDHDVEGPKITAPTAILGAPSSSCNSESDYAEIYPFVGSMHKAQFFISGASHCEFSDPGNNMCYIVCGGSEDPTGLRTQLVQKYMTAWFNYYLHRDTGYYDYLYGSEADSDIASGYIERKADIAPQNVRASGQDGAVLLAWTFYDHPMVAGYNAYRRQSGEAYPDVPQISAGRIGSYLDEGLVGGETYFYVLSSRDGAGHEHQLSSEVNATAASGPGPEPSPPPDLEERLYVPLVVR